MPRMCWLGTNIGVLLHFSISKEEVKMIATIKRFLGLGSFYREYARNLGYEIKAVRNIGFNLYRDDELIGTFSSELSACSGIYCSFLNEKKANEK